MSCRYGFRGNAGLTIIELMITISIIGVLLAVAVPAFDDMIKNNRRTSVVNELLTSFMTARSEAAKRGQPVVVCGRLSTGGDSCTGGTNWNYGYLVFVDANNDGGLNAGDVLLKQWVNDYGNDPVHQRDISITSNTGGATSGHLVFRPFNQASTGALLTVCDKRGAAKARGLIVQPTGRAQVSEKQEDGSALSCS